MMAVGATMMGAPGSSSGAIKMLSLGATSAAVGKYAGDAIIPML